MYCINVCNIPCPKPAVTELLRIISQRFSRKLPIRNVKIPARKNRYPANRIWLPAPSIASHSYPIFTHGKALPHNAQQSRARANTTPGFCNFFSIYNVISFHFYQFLSITHFMKKKVAEFFLFRKLQRGDNDFYHHCPPLFRAITGV